RRVRYRIYTSSATASPRLLPSFPTRRSSDLAVDVELLDPVARVGDEEVANLVAAEVEDVGAPVGLLAAAGVGVLVERGAVEAGQRPFVAREVRGHPVEQDADARAVQMVDEGAEI